MQKTVKYAVMQTQGNISEACFREHFGSSNTSDSLVYCFQNFKTEPREWIKNPGTKKKWEQNMELNVTTGEKKKVKKKKQIFIWIYKYFVISCPYCNCFSYSGNYERDLHG